MGLFSKFLKGSYKIFISCPNCGFKSNIKIPRGITVIDFIKTGKCECPSCSTIFYPDEYTTEYFEIANRKEQNKDKPVQAKSNKDYKKLKDFQNKDKEDIKFW